MGAANEKPCNLPGAEKLGRLICKKNNVIKIFLIILYYHIIIAF